MVKSILIVFWHGIGDCIISTPAFRELHNRYPEMKIYMAVNQRVYESNFFDECDYVEKTFAISNPWHIGKNLKEGIARLESEIDKIVKKENIEKVIYVPQHLLHGVHKIPRVYRELGLGRVKNKKTEIYISKKDREDAKKWLEKNKYKDFVFLHKKSELPKKDLPDKLANDFIKNEFHKMKIIEPGVTYSIKNKSIGFTFAILEKAKGVVVVDSAFMHAADALKKPINLAYFNLRPMVSEEVTPLNVKVNIVKGPIEKALRGKIEWYFLIKPIMIISGFFYWIYTKLKLKY